MRDLPNNASKRRNLEIFGLASFVADNPGAAVSVISQNAEAISATCRTSLYLYLKAAIEWGWIRSEGLTRSSKYFPTHQFVHHLAMRDLDRPFSERTKVGYNEDFLSSYIPNQTYYLSEAQRADLYRACPPGTFTANDSKLSTEVRRFMADLSHNSSAFEGVNVKIADTIGFLEQNIESKNMSPMDAMILRNHYNAIRFVVENVNFPAQPGDIEISEFDARNIHSSLSDGLLKDRRRQGRLRYEHVEVRDSSYIPPDHPDKIQSLFSAVMAKAKRINNPYEQSLFLLVHIPYLQPFDDCNKRTSRVICNIPLLAKGILPLSWADVNQRDYTDSLLCVYERNSVYGLSNVFVQACHRSFERFDIYLKERQPSRMEITYSREIKEAVRNRVLLDHSALPPSIDPEHMEAFEALVTEITDAMKDNDMLAGPYFLKPSDVTAWKVRAQLEEHLLSPRGRYVGERGIGH